MQGKVPKERPEEEGWGGVVGEGFTSNTCFHAMPTACPVETFTFIGAYKG